MNNAKDLGDMHRGSARGAPGAQGKLENKSQNCFFLKGGALRAQRGKSFKNVVFFLGKIHDNEISKLHIFGQNFVIIAQGS